MRGVVEDLGTPFPLIGTLPGVYQEDDFAIRLLSAFDLVLAPIVATLDNLDAYFDPELAPGDFVVWLASVLGFRLGNVWPEDRTRDLVIHAMEIYKWRGTVRGLRLLLAVYLGFEPEIVESGATAWSSNSDAPLPGNPTPSLHVRIRPRRGRPVVPSVIEALIDAAKPVHVPHRLEVVGQ